MSNLIWFIAFLSVSLSAVGQLFMKIGMTAPAGASLSSPPSFSASILNPYVIAGFAAYGVGAILWLKVLSRMELSVAYPLVSIGFVLVVLLSWVVLKEQVSIARIFGVALIMTGVTVVGYSAR